MKFKSLIPILFIIFFSCEKEVIEVIEVIDELPENISRVEPVENLVDSLNIILPEEGNFLLDNPAFFSDTIQKKIMLTKESNVYVTFIDEVAGYKNSLLWYSYNESNPPVNISDIKGNMLFPNISKIGEGGLLEAGFTLQLGTEKFPSGTVIGFYLVANGWKDGTVDYNKPTYYTDYNLNTGAEQRHILFKNDYSNNLVLGFEDYPSGACDFNDILFSVSDNNEDLESTSFDLSNVIVE